MSRRKRDRVIQPLPRDPERLELWAWQLHRRRRQRLAGPPKDRQTAVFLRWQQMRKAKCFKLWQTSAATRFRTCACGCPKECSKSMCYECHDMRKLVRKRIPRAGLVEVNERYGRIYEMPLLRHDIDYRSSRFEESENFGSLHNGVRAMENSLSYD
jgi:hypothetical protein